MENSIENVHVVEYIDSNIIGAIKTIKPDENTNVDYLCKSYPHCNVTTIRQKINYLENKNKSLIKSHNGKNFYYLIDNSDNTWRLSFTQWPTVDNIISPGNS